MNSDSESQDSDEGRRFRFATTRKDQNTTKCLSPHRNRYSHHHSRSRDRSRERRSEKTSSDKRISKESRSSSKSTSRDSSSYKSKDHSHNSDHSSKHKSKNSRHSDKKSKHKSKEKHKKRSRDRSYSKEKSASKLHKADDSSNSLEKCKIEAKEHNLSSKRNGSTNKQDHLKSSSKDEVSVTGHEKCSEVDAKRGSIIGSSLSTDMQLCQNTKDNKLSLDDSHKDKIIGPMMPTDFRKKMYKSKDEKTSISKDDENESKHKIIGPILPENFVATEASHQVTQVLEQSEDSDDGCIGPLPLDHPSLKNNQVHIQLENRAKRVQVEFFEEKLRPNKVQREEWMTELPPSHAVALGLGPRKFKTKEGPDMSDRSIWTDTPADRLRKEREKAENRFVKSENVSESPHLEEEVVEDKQESLLDMHLKTLKKSKKKLEKEAKKLGISTRRPFDREVDLQTNRLDEARKKKIFEKASKLNDRFTSGKY